MNKMRRKQLDELMKQAEAMDELAGALRLAKAAFDEAADDLKNQIEELRDEEQEAYDSMPESLQDGERGQDMQSAIEHMETAMELLDTEGIEIDSWCPDEIVSALDDAKAS